MKSRTLISIAGLFLIGAEALGGYSVRNAKQVWVPDNRDGTYTNPIIFADYSDPDVIRVGDDFYMTASSFNCAPGLPILHSRDLVNWTIIGMDKGKTATNGPHQGAWVELKSGESWFIQALLTNFRLKAELRTFLLLGGLKALV